MTLGPAQIFTSARSLPSSFLAPGRQMRADFEYAIDSRARKIYDGKRAFRTPFTRHLGVLRILGILYSFIRKRSWRHGGDERPRQRVRHLLSISAAKSPSSGPLAASASVALRNVASSPSASLVRRDGKPLGSHPLLLLSSASAFLVRYFQRRDQGLSSGANYWRSGQLQSIGVRSRRP